MKVLCLAPLVLIGVVESAQAALPNGLSDLYVQAAAVAAKCTGKSFNQAEAATLARNIAKASGTTIPSTELLQRITRAKQAFTADGGNCASPFARVHMQFFANLMPQAQAADRDAATLGAGETR
jgi:hypothetical protein